MTRYRPEDFGSAAFKRDHGVQLAYVAGAMVHGIASGAMVARLARAGLLGYFGTGGLGLDRIEEEIRQLQQQLKPHQPYGMNLLSNVARPAFEDATVELFLRCGVRRIEAAAFMEMRPSIVRYRANGLSVAPDGSIRVENRVLAKVSRPEVARAFFEPPSASMLRSLVERKLCSAEQAKLAEAVPVVDDVCVEADSGGHTDRGVAILLLPAIRRLRDAMAERHRELDKVRIGGAGGVGTGEAAFAYFMLGADFVLTGSINQCTVEAGTSPLVKDMLQRVEVYDTEMAPAGDMFEIGARVQVLRKGVFFPARANKLYELYQRLGSLDELDAATRQMIETKYFGRTFDDVWGDTCRYFEKAMPEQLEKARRDPRRKMALVFKWYFVHSNRLALSGDQTERVNFQVHCGPAMGAFNQRVRGTAFEDWRRRHVDEVAWLVMRDAAAHADAAREKLGRGLDAPVWSTEAG